MQDNNQSNLPATTTGETIATVEQMRDNARRQLAQVHSLEDGVDYLNKLGAYEQLIRGMHGDAELQNEICEHKIRTQRKIGSFLREKEVRKNKGLGNRFIEAADREGSKTVTDYGITHKQSANFQKLAELSEQSFDDFIDAAKSVPAKSGLMPELTTAGMLRQMKQVHVSHNSGEVEWYTPKEYIDSARTVMGTIDLDPASSEAANVVVDAAQIFTEEISGLDHDWFGNVWINPPYAAQLMQQFADAIVENSNNFEQAIILVNNATETAWFHQILSVASAMCIKRRRVQYWRVDGGSNSPLQGQVFLYVGDSVDLFIDEFSKHGFCITF